ncbi:hypothetical protein [Candidatus Nitrotoga sp. 1052]|uniref:hypothetical protein n=1 Tax=Candidatus Nitrotoga sp. 1052 TaxID=2886964 RepID=UPI001EF41DAC|nr:hypothetical protein [Candidatus Nitrotoga sp. 1052]
MLPTKPIQLTIFCAGRLPRPDSRGGWQKSQHIRASRQAKRERGIWQHRMWGEKTGDGVDGYGER